MAFEDEKDGERRRKSEHGAVSEAPDKKTSKGKRPSPEIGSALRSVYQRTVSEDIPPEMLDLLGKLG